MAPPIIRPGIDPDVIRLWSMPRLEVEAVYRKVFAKDDIVAIRWLGRNDRYFLLSCLLRRPDVRNDWVFDRIREVEADPYDRIDMWSREHYKLEPLDIPTISPSGWKLHGDLVPGDEIFGPDGKITKVVALNKIVTDAEAYEIEFDDGFKIVAGAEHLWPIERRTKKRIPMAYNKPGPKRLYRETVLMRTSEIAACGHAADRRLAVRVSDPLVLPDADLPIDPYVLGAWLGDGSRDGSGIAAGFGDADEMEQLLSGCGLSVRRSPHSNCVMLRIGSGLRGKRGSSDFASAMRALGVYRAKAVPALYLRASIAQRLALLQGLMDTDGHCDIRGTATFCNTNDALVDGFTELCHTLGLKPRRRRVVGEYKGEPYPYWQVSFQAYKALPPFRLTRKLARCKDGARPKPRRFIVACRRVPPVPMRCIQVDRPDGLYLTGRAMIPTHNSTIITFAGSIQEILNDPEVTIAIFSYDRPAATQFLNQIKVEFEENDLLKKVYDDVLWADPIKQARRWGEQSGIVVKRKGNPKEATVEAWGVVDGQPTGRHFKIRIYDDLVTQKNVTTPEQVRKTTESFDLSENLGTRGGKQIMVGTRYHYSDTYAHLISRGMLKERRYPATHDGTFDGTPVFLTQAEWDRKKKGSRSVVAAQMLLNPLEGTETAFDPRMLKFWRVRPKRCNCYIIGDASKGKNASSDFTAIVVLLVDVAGNKYLIDGWRHRMTLSQRWVTLRDAYRRWRSIPGILDVRVGYEQFAMQTDNEYFEERMLTERISFPIEELNWPRTGPKSKQQRIERLEPQFRLGRLLLPEVIQISDEGIITPYDVSKTKDAQEAVAAGEKWRVAQPIHKKDNDKRVYDFMAAFMEEFMFFPFAGYDDILDAMSRIVDMDPQPASSDYSENGGDPSAATLPEVFVDGI